MPAALKYRNARGDLVDIERITATRLKNEPGSILDQAATGRAVVVTKHSTPRVVILSFEDFGALTRDRESSLGELDERFDGLLATMQTAKAKKGVAAAFNAVPEALGRTAVKAARRQRKVRRAG
ncbi:MAG: type II toxin-antitoxin system prevent-host-death family antitoxin [Usitatibacter sp.]